jgi:hypothetical protein
MAAFAGAPAPAGAATMFGAAALDAKATLHVCHFAPDQQGRYAVFGGSMKSLRDGDDRMQMRFDLYRRLPGNARYQHVAAPGLGGWNKAAPSVTRYRFRQKVENLPAPASYRAVVSYRWLTAAGKVFARTKRTTPVCVEPDPRPNLRVSRITGAPAPGGNAFYDVVVRNDGRSAASDFDLLLTVNGAARPAKQVATLAAGARKVVRFTAPRCAAGSTVKADVDPDNRVAERDETDNSLAVDCPAL